MRRTIRVIIILNLKVKGKKITLSVKEHLNKIKSCLKDTINDFKKSYSWKIQLIITNNLPSSKDENDKDFLMHSKNDDIDILINDEADEVIKEHFKLIEKK